jgi:hypothetical protein
LEALEGRLLPSVYTVINTADGGEGSLRQAILDADAHPGPDTVIFDIPGAGMHTIQPLSPLPAITDPLVLDATSQPGYAGSPLIELNGASAGASASGLTIAAGGSTVRGLVINAFAKSGVALQGNGGNAVVGDWIGTDATGTAPRPNRYGVSISNSSNNAVGGTGAGDGNTISGNTLDGVSITGGGNVVQGNRIGTDVTGTRVLSYNRAGVFIFGSNNNAVGGTEAGAGNTISGNGNGVSITGGGGNVVQGNRIGTDVTGTAHLPNVTGVFLTGSGNAVGGTAAGAGNTIAFNQTDGVLVDLGTGNALLRNALFGNGRLGIELTGGGNHNQPPPTLTSATFGGGVLTVQGTLQGLPATTYTVELFANSAGGPAQGERFLASLTVTTGPDGSATFTVSLAVAVDPGESVTATATDPGNNTSPFSNAALVTGPTLVAVAEAGPGAAPVAGAAGAGWVAPPVGAAPAAPPDQDPPTHAARAPALDALADAGPCPPWLGLDLVFEALGRLTG